MVVPFHNKGSTSEPNNYKTISLLSVFSKVIEKIMKKKIIGFLQRSNGVLSKNQFGFVEGKSTEDALLHFSHEVFEGINIGNCVSGLFIDITKALDAANHMHLLNKLSSCGVRSVALKWFQSYVQIAETRMGPDQGSSEK